jgi:hypothetical protein
MPTLYTQASSLVDYQNTVWDHLTDCGMDTIAQLPDPENLSMMANVVKSHSRYTVATAKTLSSHQLLLCNKYDKTIDLATITFPFSLLDPALISKIKEKAKGGRRLISCRLAPAHLDNQINVDRALRRPQGRNQSSPSVSVRWQKLEALAADY